MLEDVLLRHKAHGAAHFWRMAGGAKVNLLLERGVPLHALASKTARASSPYLTRGLRAIMEDTVSVSAIDCLSRYSTPGACLLAKTDARYRK